MLIRKTAKPCFTKFFFMYQCYIPANLVKIHPPESVTPMLTLMPKLTPTGSAPKTICPSPLQWENFKAMLPLWFIIIVVYSMIYPQHFVCFVYNSLVVNCWEKSLGFQLVFCLMPSLGCLCSFPFNILGRMWKCDFVSS